MPAGEGGEEEKAEEGKDDGDDAGNFVSIDAMTGWKMFGADSHEVWKHYTIFERRCHPYQIQRILIHRYLCR